MRGRPAAITRGSGPEFAGPALAAWADKEGVPPDPIAPGKPTRNGHLERSNGRPRDACLDQHRFTDPDDAQAPIAAWRDDHNAVRPHSARGKLTPLDFAERLRHPGKLSA